MFFIVTARRPTGRVSFTCDKPHTALERARGLTGADDVVIADGDGLQYAPRDFARLVRG